MIVCVSRLIAAAFLVLAVTGMALPVPGQPPAAAPAPKKAAEEKKPRSIPFNGKLLAFNKAARTFTVGKRVFRVTPETKLFKPGQVPATLDDGLINGLVTGSYYKIEEGNLVARNVYFGGKGDSKTVVAPAKPAGGK